MHLSSGAVTMPITDVCLCTGDILQELSGSVVY